MTELLRQMTINVRFQRNGRTLYSGTTYAGFVTILNGVKEGKFAFSLNQRLTNAESGAAVKNLLKWAVGLIEGSPITVVTRRLFEEEANTYEEARDFLSRVPLVSPLYLIVGGGSGNQGCVITRSVDNSLQPQTLQVSSVKPTWILQTNYDHWEAPPADDDRRTPGNLCMRNSLSMSFAALFNVLTTKPVLLQEVTYTSLMDAKLGKLETYVRMCPYPCSPGPVHSEIGGL